MTDGLWTDLMVGYCHFLECLCLEVISVRFTHCLRLLVPEVFPSLVDWWGSAPRGVFFFFFFCCHVVWP